MEYGGITPLGLPPDWRVLVDARVVVADHGTPAGTGTARPATHPAVIIGSGIRGSKISLPGALLGRLPGAEVVPDLAIG
jgi:prolyl-tRNA editing enzyme YbaK/EbsC (Cys-tRNA(Pro) deacylase)